jgi:DNA gyrase/topoisomerase IV subunit A
LFAVADLGGTPAAGYRKTTRVLDRVEAEHGIGARYVYPMLQDLQASYRLHLPLIDGKGNWGTQYGDPAADAQYTELRLTPVGALAVAAERGELGPLPLGLIEGTLYRDGVIPPFDPARVVTALRDGSADAGPPVLPSGGPIEGDIEALLAGKPARLAMGCAMTHEDDAVVITAVPMGVDIDRVVQNVEQRLRTRRFVRDPPRPDYDRPEELDPEPVHVTDVRDEGNMRVCIRVVCTLVDESHRAAAVEWLRSLWPVTIQADCRLPAPMAVRLTSWNAGDGTGLAALDAELGDAD